MSILEYRTLRREEARLLGSIDRAEVIDGFYSVVAGKLELRSTRLDVTGWEDGQVEAYVARLVALFDAGGTILGAFQGPDLLGLGSLDVRPVGGDPRVSKLDMLYVSSVARNRGIGRKLTALLSEQARARGARALYVSATPTRNTVDAYLRMGAKLLDSPDPDLFLREPEDVHLLIEL